MNTFELFQISSAVVNVMSPSCTTPSFITPTRSFGPCKSQVLL
jgi:hypothetical protein